MQLATILPTKYLNLIEEKPYHMALAHLVGKDTVYTDFYYNAADSGAYVILDNGVIEGDQQSIEDICKKAELIGAAEIILPDVFQECDATISSTRKALKYVKSKYPHLKVMAVPQGDSIDEWLYCARILLSWDIDCIGIPKVLTKLGGRDARLTVLHELKEEIIEANVAVHLLGCWENPIECTMIAKAELQGLIPPVRGCDSAIAFVYAQAGIVLSEDARPKGAVDFADSETDIELLKRNIHIWEQSVILKRGKVVEIL